MCNVTFILVFFLSFLAIVFLSSWYVYWHNSKAIGTIQQSSKTWTICHFCGNLVWLRTFLCPACKTENSLFPTMDADFNVHLVQPCCKCGNGLPVAHFIGREQLTAVCSEPGCRKPIGERAGLYHEKIIPIVGSRSTGKSAYLSALLFALRREYDNAINFPFPGIAEYAEDAFKITRKDICRNKQRQLFQKVLSWIGKTATKKQKRKCRDCVFSFMMLVVKYTIRKGR